MCSLLDVTHNPPIFSVASHSAEEVEETNDHYFGETSFQATPGFNAVPMNFPHYYYMSACCPHFPVLFPSLYYCGGGVYTNATAEATTAEGPFNKGRKKKNR